jgi:peptidoglycan lytic transglycosylase D
MRVLIAVFCVLGYSSFGQTPKVPSKMEFAGIQLKISDGARKELQEKVNKLTKSQKYFRLKVDRAASYFPIVEQIFEEEGVPDDFKYLAIQESGYVSDVVSTSNAVGYWQFKKETAEEMGLKVNSKVDERLNIVSSSRGAARYFQQNNLFFNNWLHALQAYQMGAGGTQRSLTKIESGAKSMHITKKTYWYVLTFLAHKIAYEQAIELARNSAPKMYIYTEGANKSLKEISKNTDAPLDSLRKYNKWLKTRIIPADKIYAVIIPNFSNLPISPVEIEKDNALAQQLEESTISGIRIPHTMPAIKQLTINGLPAIMSNTEITIDELVEKFNIAPTDFSSYNDILPHYHILPNQVYYLKRKMPKAKIYYHTIKNRMPEAENDIEVGRVLWLKKIRPKNHPVEYK